MSVEINLESNRTINPRRLRVNAFGSRLVNRTAQKRTFGPPAVNDCVIRAEFEVVANTDHPIC